MARKRKHAKELTRERKNKQYQKKKPRRTVRVRWATELRTILPDFPPQLCDCVLTFLFTPQWITPTIHLLNTFPLASLIHGFQNDSHTLLRKEATVHDLVIRMETQLVRVLETHGTRPIPWIHLCQYEGHFLQSQPSHAVLGTVGFILHTLGAHWGTHLDGREISNWATTRARVGPQDSSIPASLRAATLTELLVYYSVFHGIPTIYACQTWGLVWYSLPWLAGYLYGEKGIIWMLFVLLYLSRTEPFRGPSSSGESQREGRKLRLQDMENWTTHALIGHTETHRADMYPDNKIQATLSVLYDPGLLVSATTRALSHTLLPILPNVLVGVVLEYQVEEWVETVQASFHRKDDLLSRLVAHCRSKVPRPVKRKVKIRVYLTQPLQPTLTWNLTNAQLCENEHHFLQTYMNPAKLPPFGTMILEYEKCHNTTIPYGHKGFKEILSWNLIRSAQPNVDTCIPLQLRDASLTALLCYYANYRVSSDTELIVTAIAWLTGYIYRESGLRWMLFVIRHICPCHLEPFIGIFDLQRLMHYGLFGATRIKRKMYSFGLEMLGPIVQSFLKK